VEEREEKREKRAVRNFMRDTNGSYINNKKLTTIDWLRNGLKRSM
jgi:hypothetical protein